MLLTGVQQSFLDVSSDRVAAVRPRTVRDVLTPAQLGWVVRRERARADRNHCDLTIVCLSIPGNDREAVRERWRVAHVLLRVLRETDEIGWHDGHTLCAVLTDTDATGADMFLKRLQAASEGRAFEPDVKLFVHRAPVDRTTGEDAQGVTRRQALRQATAATRVAPAAPLGEFAAEPLPAWKRGVDLIVASAAILAASPLLIGAALAIKLASPGPIIFKQLRTGLGGRPFTIYKFRTMCVDAEARKAALRAISEQDGPAFKLQRDPRVFAAGSFLRKTSIDELPQLFNVLKGDMTLVGPRPLPVNEADACEGWQQRRHAVTPGLTCIWQVEGRSRVKFEEWMRMDMRYAKRRNLFTDLWLVLRTVPAVLLRRGAK
jgi:lipopolysaccharide/colanic/teichoic acid biosynthesis glycosyltransferase